MDPQERKIIDELFDKLDQAARQAGPREPLAEAHIRSRIEKQPGAPYLMAQTIVMQEQALEVAQARLAALEEEIARRPAGGGFLSGLFGGGATGRESAARESAAAPQNRLRPDAGFGSQSFGRTLPQGQAGRRGGFLAGAAQTAMGVAGGVLIGSLIGNAFGAGEAKAAEAPAPEQPAFDDAGADPGADAGADAGDDAMDFGDDEI